MISGSDLLRIPYARCSVWKNSVETLFLTLAAGQVCSVWQLVEWVLSFIHSSMTRCLWLAPCSLNSGTVLRTTGGPFSRGLYWILRGQDLWELSTSFIHGEFCIIRGRCGEDW